MAVSPDGLVGADALLEVKCSSKHRNSAEDALTDTSYGFVKDSNGNITLKTTSIWYDQIQAQLHVCERKLCYLMMYIPKQSFIVEVPFDSSWTANVDKLYNLYWKDVFPSLFEKHLDE
jgi:hypothetical protein